MLVSVHLDLSLLGVGTGTKEHTSDHTQPAVMLVMVKGETDFKISAIEGTETLLFSLQVIP